MTRRVLASLVVACGLVVVLRAQAVPERLTDVEFWALTTDLSEVGGDFHSDNFTSNEADFADVATELAAHHQGGAYLGVGPEQNFSYIAAIRPSIAFLVDIRRQAVVQHLLYKALFEMSTDRADFLARLFSRVKPDAVDASSIARIWDAFPVGPGTNRELYLKNRQEVSDHLTKTHKFALSTEDLASLDYVYSAFFSLGPDINYAGFQQGLTTGNMTFAKLSVKADKAGALRSFLASEGAFQFIKTLQTRNLIVPVQADLAGPKAIRGIGDYLRAHDATVTAFYISNVEQYLFGSSSAPAIDINGGWHAFYDTLATLPITPSSVLVRGLSRTAITRCPIWDFLKIVAAGKVKSMGDAGRCGS
jgi:hypothetical protein